ncbi:MAG: hypothetical protein ABIW50_00695 [Candidatus Limnocylindria bacterium]
MTTTVLFLCPHAAGKSLIAATYFQAAVVRSGLDVLIDVAGPEPDEKNIPAVVAALEAQGYEVGWEPRLVTAHDADRADIIVSIGCDRSAIPTSQTVTEWQVPLLSEDLSGSMRAIHERAEHFQGPICARG